MKYKQIARDELVRFYRDGLVKYEMGEERIERLVINIRLLHSYMEREGIDTYTPEVGTEFRNWTESESFGEFKKTCIFRATDLLDLVVEGKPYKLRKSRMCGQKLPGKIGDAIKSFIKYLEDTKNICAHTKEIYYCRLRNFAVFSDMRGISSETLSESDLMDFFASVQNTNAHILGDMRRFLSFMYEERMMKTDLSQIISDIRPKRHEKIPSYYDKDEVMKLEQSVDRTGAIGKRDYAIILLASRLGLRASDISGLKFSNIDWDTNKIHIIQQKTKESLSLPLLSDVGDAIIDYVKNGRPKTDLSTIFVTSAKPYRQLNHIGISTIVGSHFFAAGIDTRGRHKGAHSLRHSLSSSLLSNGVIMPIISECLGHACSQSTMYYLSIDIKSLLECSLDVPPVDDAFYNQKGGMLYE